MKLLLDQNLSHKILPSILEYFPGSLHVRQVALHFKSDTLSWNYAREHDFIIVSKDADFHQRSFLVGFPPKVIGIMTGNEPAAATRDLILESRQLIVRFGEDPEASFLELPHPKR